MISIFLIFVGIFTGPQRRLLTTKSAGANMTIEGSLVRSKKVGRSFPQYESSN